MGGGGSAGWHALAGGTYKHYSFHRLNCKCSYTFFAGTSSFHIDSAALTMALAVQKQNTPMIWYTAEPKRKDHPQAGPVFQVIFLRKKGGAFHTPMYTYPSLLIVTSRDCKAL